MQIPSPTYLLKHIKALTTYFSASLIPVVLNLAINPLVSLSMDPEDFAIVGYFTSFSTLLSPLIAFYMIFYYNKRYFELDEQGRNELYALVFKSLIFFSFAVTILCIVGIVVYIKRNSSSFPIFPYLYMAIMTLPFCGLYNLELSKYKMQKQAKSYFNLSTVRSVGSVMLILLCVVILKWGAFGKLLAPFIIEIAIFLYLLLKNQEVWTVKTRVKDLLPILKFCWPLTLGAAAGYFSNGFDKMLLERLGNDAEFGYYCVGTSIATYLSIFTYSISATFQPDLYESIIQKNKRKFFKVATVRVLLIFALVIIFIVFTPLIVKVLTAGKYMPSVPYAQTLACVAFTSSIYYIINDFSIARGKPYLCLITTLIGSLIIVLLMPLFIKSYSYNGGAIMNVLSFLMLSVINILLLGIDKYINTHSSNKAIR